MVIYSCKVCKITTIIKCQYIRHLNTNKHKFNILEVKVSPLEEKSKSKVSIIESIIEEKDIEKLPQYSCKYCGQKYKHKQSVTKHIKFSCSKNKDEDLHH